MASQKKRRPAKKGVVLAIDMGTSSTRAAIYDAHGRRLERTTSQVVYPLQTSADGRAELVPGDLADALKRAVGKTLKAYRAEKSGVPIIGIAVSCFWHSLLGLNARGRPLTPIYTWADSRCRHDAALLRRHGGEAIIHAHTGCMARASFWPAKLLWLKRTQKALFHRVAKWVSPAEWLQQLWCGSATVSLSMASGTGLLDARTLRWNDSLLRRCDVRAAQLNPLSERYTTLSAPIAGRFPELRGVPWFPAIGDGAASNLGSGAVRPGIAAINIGTSAALRVIVPAKPGRKQKPPPLGLFAYRVDARRKLLGGAVSNAGNLHAWALREMRLPKKAPELEKQLAARQLPIEHLTVLPFWMAERAPTWPEDLPSVVVGITQSTTALDMIQSLQEATYHRLAQIAELVEKSVGRRLTIIVSGGIRHSNQSLQRLANVLGRPVHPSPEPEASLRGAALFVLEQLGHRPSDIVAGKPFRPSPAAIRAYAAARARQVQLEQSFRRLHAST
jgi:gluconokinase